MSKTTNPRKKKLDAICTKIATFIVSETYRDEGEAQSKLAQAIQTIEDAEKLLVEADEKAAKTITPADVKA